MNNVLVGWAFVVMGILLISLTSFNMYNDFKKTDLYREILKKASEK